MPPSDKSIPLSHIGATVTIIIWGVTFIASKILLDTFSTIEILVLRFTIGVIVLTIVDAIRTRTEKERKRLSMKDEITFFFAGVSGVALYYMMETVALTKTSASNVGILVSLAPITTAALALIWLKEERFYISYLYGFIIAFIGVYLVITNGSELEGFSAAGDMIAVLGTFAWASYSLILKRIDTGKYHIITYTKKILMYGLIVLIPFGYLSGFDITPSDFTLQNIFLLLIFLGIGASALCFMLWNYAVDHLGVYKASAYIYASPLVTLVTAGVVLHEPIALHAVIGSVCIIGGLYLSEHRFSLKRVKA
ncbi:MAG: DMT family transporter [Sphaerochaetaceae bacterium]